MDKEFDAVGWMRKRREELDIEMGSLSWEERRERIRAQLGGDPLWERLKGRVVEAQGLTPGRPVGSERGSAA